MVTSGPGVHETPSWSPDGTWIAYGYSPILPWDTGFRGTVLYRIAADGSNPTLIGDPDAFDYEPKISPDGTQVLFQRWFGDGQAAPLVVADLATGDERIVKGFGGLNAAWSPDGSRIAMQTDPSGADIWGPLITIAADGDPASTIELYPGGAERGGFKPTYSPDGSRVAFGCGHGAGTDDYDEAICVVDADGGDAEVFVDTDGSWENEVAWGVTATGQSAAPATAESPTSTPGPDAGASATVAPAATADAPSTDPDHPYCDIERRIDEHFEIAFSGLGNDATEQQQVTAAQAAAQAVVAAGLLEEADANAPEAIRTDLDVLIANVTAAADGNVDVFFTPESDQAGRRVDAFCGLSD